MSKITRKRNKIKEVDEPILNFHNILNHLSPEDVKYINELIDYARSKGYIFFSEIEKRKRKKVEIEYVKQYRECQKKNDLECQKEYLERLFFGNLLYIIRKCINAYKHRINDDVTLQDLINYSIIGIQNALKNYEINNKWNARFLSYANKYIRGALHKQIVTNSVHTIDFSAIEHSQSTVMKNNNYTIDDTLTDQDTYQEYSQYELSYEDRCVEQCNCIQEVNEYIFENRLELDILDCMLQILTDKSIIDCLSQHMSYLINNV